MASNFLSVGFSLLSIFCVLSEGKPCPGYCTKNLVNCTSNNGKIVGYCTTEMACCDIIEGLTGSCGSSYKRLNTTYFKSPNFPKNSSGDLNCEFRLKLSDNAIGIRIDFLRFETDGLSYGLGKSCDSDMFFIRGFETWTPPPRCGKLNGYSTVIDRKNVQAKEMKTLTLMALMSSPGYLWHIKVAQIFKPLHGENALPKKARDLDRDLDGELGQRVSSTDTSESAQNEFLAFDAPLFQSEIINLEDAVEFNTSRNLSVKTSAIVNGVETKSLDVPWQASIRIVYSTEKYSLESIQELMGENCSHTEGSHFCGGSIIGEDVILCAAHCFFGVSKTQGMTDLSTTKVILGDTNRCKDEPSDFNSSYEYDIETVTFHYAYDGATIDSDIAVIKLKTKIEFRENIKIIRMTESDFEYTDGRVLVSGWGMTNLDENAVQQLPNVLQSSDQFTIENKTFCHQVLEESLGDSAEGVKRHVKYDHIYEGIFCTGSRNATAGVFTGSGDSGGSLVVFDSNAGEYLQMGIVSYALTFKPNNNNTNNVDNDTISTGDVGDQNKTCGVADYVFLDYFQSVPFYRPWIDLVMLQ